MRSLLIAIDLCPFDPKICVQHIIGKDISFFEKSPVLVQGNKRLAQASAHGGDIFLFLGREVVKVLIHGRTRVNLVLDSVQAGQQYRRKRKVRISGGIGKAHLDSFGFAARSIGNAARGRAIGCGICQHYRRFKPRDQALIAVGYGVGKGVYRASVLYDSVAEST